MELKDFSATDASQTIFVEGMARAQVNNDARTAMGAIARHHLDNNGSLATAGTSTAITVTLNQQLSAWYDGLTFAARITTTCGATPTINPTGSGALGAKSLYWAGSGIQVAAGDLVSTSVAQFMYEATSDKVYVFGSSGLNIIGALGATDNAVLRADGTGGATAQGSVATLGDTGSLSISSTAAGVTLTRADNGNFINALFDVYHNSATPANDDTIQIMRALANDSGGNLTILGSINFAWTDVTNGSEDSRFYITTIIGGVESFPFTVGAGLYTSSATGGDMGADTINASAVYDDGVKLGRTFVSEVSLSGGAGTTFSSIPAGVRRITVNLRGVSLDDTDSILIQLGTSGGLVATGYASTSTTLAAGAATTGYTTGFGIRSIIAANVFSGHMVLTHVGGNVWVASLTGKADTATTIVGGGDVSLGAELDRLAILDTGADNFDAGTISIMYEF